MTNVLATASDEAFVDLIRRALAQDPAVQVRAWPGSLNGVGTVEAIAARRPDVVIVGPDVSSAEAFDVAERLEEADSSIIVVVAADTGPDAWRRALEAGVRSVIDPGGTLDEVRSSLTVAVDSARRRRSVGGPNGAAHRVIVVASPKGGVGKTVVATNLAVSLAAASSRRVVLVDLDLEFGDVSHAMMLTPEYSIADAAASLHDVDMTALKVYLTQHSSGAFVLTAPEDAVRAGEVRADAAAAIVDLLTAEFPFVVVDTSAGLADHTLSVMEHATDVVIISDMDVPSVRNVRKELDMLEILGIGGHRLHFVLNRSDSNVGLRVVDVAATAGIEIDVQIPSSRHVPVSVNEGRPITISRPRSAVSKRLIQLAQRIAAMAPDIDGGGEV